MKNKAIVARKPNNVLFGVGEHTTLIQNRVITTALSFFNSGMTTEEIQKLSPKELTELAKEKLSYPIEIPLSLFAEDYDNTQVSFKKSLVEQIRKLIHVGYSQITDTSIRFCNVFQQTKYVYRENHITVCFTSVFIEDLVKMVINGYTPIRLQYYLLLTKEYSSKLYYQIISNLTFQRNFVEITYEVEEFQSLLGIVDLEGNYNQKSYKEWYIFKREALEPAIQDINTNSDIEISYTTKRKGRKIHWITLSIKRKPEIKPLTQQEASKHISLFMSLGIQQNRARELSQKYPLAFSEFATKRAQQKSNDNPAGYLLTSIDDMYELWEMKQEKEQALKEAEELRKKAEEQAKAEAKRKEAEAKQKKDDEKAQMAEERARFQALQAEFDALPKEIQQKLQKEKSLRMETMFLPDALFYKQQKESGLL